jgi:hypothetical protein
MANEVELDVIRDGIKQPDASKEQIDNVIEQPEQPDGEPEYLTFEQLEQLEQLDGEIQFAAVVTGNIDSSPERQEIENQEIDF